MRPEQILQRINDELVKAEKEFPGWPKDIVHGAAIVQEESGEFGKACLDFFYRRGGRRKVTKEAIQTAAMIFRFLFHIDEYEPGEK